MCESVTLVVADLFGFHFLPGAVGRMSAVNFPSLQQALKLREEEEEEKQAARSAALPVQPRLRRAAPAQGQGDAKSLQKGGNWLYRKQSVTASTGGEGASVDEPSQQISGSSLPCRWTCSFPSAFCFALSRC